MLTHVLDRRWHKWWAPRPLRQGVVLPLLAPVAYINAGFHSSSDIMTSKRYFILWISAFHNACQPQKAWCLLRKHAWYLLSFTWRVLLCFLKTNKPDFSFDFLCFGGIASAVLRLFCVVAGFGGRFGVSSFWCWLTHYHETIYLAILYYGFDYFLW